jgi:DNA (cytosine-5)-methyltransferase 1
MPIENASILWNSVARDLLKSELSKRKMSARDLALRLAEIGVEESSGSISNKLSRGSFSARFLLQSLFAIDSKLLKIPEGSMSAVLDNGDCVIEEPSHQYGISKALWDGLEGFFYNSYDQEWFVDTKIRYMPSKLVGGKVISLFTGAGGLDIGLEKAGFETVGCVEIDEDCKETLRRNRPHWNIIEGEASGDVKHVSTDDILNATGLRVGEAALVTGGAPCQPFSNIGKREGVGDSRNGGDLFQEFVRIVTGLMPRAFIFENVVGITQQKHREVLNYMKSCLGNSGYSITYKVMNAANYGVPQKRNRFILIGLRGENVPALPFPTHFKSKDDYQEICFQLGKKPSSSVTTWKTVGDAFLRIDGWADKRDDNVVMNISDVVRSRMELIGPGENFHVIPMSMRPNCWKNGKHQGQDTFGRLKLDEPSVTIRTAAYNPAKGRYIHPTENRGLNSMELAALQGFPKGWHFFSKKYPKVTLTSAGKQIGNAVPPPLGEALGRALNLQLSLLSERGIEQVA